MSPSFCGEPVCWGSVTTSYAKMPGGLGICGLGLRCNRFAMRFAREVAPQTKSSNSAEWWKDVSASCKNFRSRCSAGPFQKSVESTQSMDHYNTPHKLCRLKAGTVRHRTPNSPLSLPEHSEATDRIPKRTTHEDIRQEMNVEREP